MPTIGRAAIRPRDLTVFGRWHMRQGNGIAHVSTDHGHIVALQLNHDGTMCMKVALWNVIEVRDFLVAAKADQITELWRVGVRSHGLDAPISTAPVSRSNEIGMG